MKRFAVGFLALACMVSAYAQSDLFGERSYTSQRGLSGLGGAGFALDKDGNVTLRGATSLSTPVGNILGPRQWFLVGSNLSHDLSPRFPSRIDFQNDATKGSNGTAALMASFTIPLGVICIGGYATTGDFDTSLNVQFSPKGQKGMTRFSFGVQDVFGTAAANNGSIQKVIGGGESQSPFVVATTDLGKDVHLSYGAGLRRFKGPFGSLSMPVGPVQGFVEWDTFNWNFGLTTRIYHKEMDLGARQQNAFLSAGVVRGKYLYWSLGFQF